MNVTIQTDNHEFIDYLNHESMLVKPNCYTFSSCEKASEVISRFMLFFLRETKITSFFHSNLLSAENREEFNHCLSSVKIAEILESIRSKLFVFLETNELLHFEGFIEFRLKAEKEALLQLLNEAIHDYYEVCDEKTNLAGLRAILLEQEEQCAELNLFLDDTFLYLLNEETVYLEDSPENEDTALSHIILLSPGLLHVYDPQNLLSKETTIILKHLFRERVEFFNEPYSFSDR